MRDLLACFDLTDTIVTLDAMHTQTDTATAITSGSGHYVLTIKGNTPTLHRKLKALPWKDIPAHSVTQTGRGKRSTRTIKVATVPDWIEFPGAAQVAHVRRTVTTKRQEERRGHLPDHLRRPGQRTPSDPRRMGPMPLVDRGTACTGCAT